MAGRVTRNGFNQADLVDLLRRLRNYSHSATGTLPNLAPGATVAADVKNNNIIVANVDGKQVHKAVTDPLMDLSTFTTTATAADQSTVVLLQMNDAGTMSVKQGPVVAGTTSDDIKTLPVPVPDAGVAVVGHIIIAGTAHTFGTTALTAAMLKDGDPYLMPSINRANHGNVGLES